jgi:DNA-binding NtrC family response regulator
MDKGNLLLIDDEVLLLEKTSILLEDIADKVFTSKCGKDGLKLLNENPIQCVICDINMPEMNGVEVLKKVRETHPEIPFIFYTGHGSRELMREAIKYGAFDFVNKPCLKGLEEIAIRGLSAGLGIDDVNQDCMQSFETEFKKLMK